MYKVKGKCMEDNTFYVGRYKDEQIVKKSSSGGIMTAIAEVFFKNYGVVFGAAFTKNFRKIEHIAVKRMDDLELLRKSKYVWSDYTVCLDDLDYYLGLGDSVLFIGTPCQCMAVKKKFGEYKNLYLLDFFCHGTLDAKYYSDYIDSLKTKICKVDFRGEGIENNNMKFVVVDSDNIVVVEDDYDDNILTKLFSSSAGLRNGCMQCAIGESIHSSNITMGDVQFEEMASNHGFDKNHLSFISVNDKKGKEVFELVKESIEYEQLDKEDSNSIAYYYRKRINSTDPWGYNIELHSWFQDAYNRYGFKEAAYRCMYKNELQLLKKYDFVISKKKIYLYGAGKKGYIYKTLIDIYYPECSLEGYIVTKKEMDEVNGLRVFKSSDIKLDTEDIFIIITVVKNEEIITYLRKMNLVENINFGYIT